MYFKKHFHLVTFFFFSDSLVPKYPLKHIKLISYICCYNKGLTYSLHFKNTFFFFSLIHSDRSLTVIPVMVERNVRPSKWYLDWSCSTFEREN